MTASPAPAEIDAEGLAALEALFRLHGTAVVRPDQGRLILKTIAMARRTLEAEEGWHYADGVADLALKHRDMAEERAVAATARADKAELALAEARARIAELKEIARALSAIAMPKPLSADRGRYRGCGRRVDQQERHGHHGRDGRGGRS